MATLAPLSTPSRQPFGVLNDSKLRSLQSTKNRQNGINFNSGPSLKRRAPSPELSDAENVDPNRLDTHGKRKKACHDEDVSLSKPSKYTTHVITTPKSQAFTSTTTTTPRLHTLQKPSTAPLSAPPAAGRSPTKGKRMGLMQPRRRFAPSSLGTKSPSLSITAALNGTLAHKKAKKLRTIEESKPKSWFFDIFEESEEQQDYRMNEWTMTQSATGLDISDDEGKLKGDCDKGKENVDPDEAYAPPTTRSASTTLAVSVPKTSRKDAMLDEPRTPLGDLNPSEFYGEGLDATSVVLVHEDTEAYQEEPTSAPLIEKKEIKVDADFTFETSEKLSVDISNTNEDIHAVLAVSEPNWEALQPSSTTENIDDSILHADSGPIEIWESESAKDEEEQVDENLEQVKGFALQEL